MWIQDMTPSLTMTSWEIIVASSSFEDLCLKHINWKYLTTNDSLALWLAMDRFQSCKDEFLPEAKHDWNLYVRPILIYLTHLEERNLTWKARLIGRTPLSFWFILWIIYFVLRFKIGVWMSLLFSNTRVN